VAVSVFTRKPSWKDSGFRLDNLRPALIEVSLVSSVFLFGFFLLIWAEGISFKPPATWRGAQLVASGILQQAFFLGYLFHRWSSLVQNPIGAVALTAVCFGLIHLPGIYLTALTGLGGVVLGVLFMRSRNVWTVGFAHGLLAALMIPTLQSSGALATTQIGPAELLPLAAKLALELRPGDRVALGPNRMEPAQLGSGLDVPVEKMGDANAGAEANRERLVSFLLSRERVFCVLLEEDYELYLKPSFRERVFVLDQHYLWRVKFRLDGGLLGALVHGAGDVPVLGALRQRVLLVSNRPAQTRRDS
jgi:hypothetical protein